jgi:hypothetical protein
MHTQALGGAKHMSYAHKLAEMGITASRIEDITEAMNGLHRALCKLDNSQLKSFSSTFGLIGHLDMFAREEELRNVAVDMYNNNLRQSVKNIDFDEFPDFSDKLFYLAEQAAEVKIPGAHQLCKSLVDLRRNFTIKGMLFSRIAQQAENIAAVNGIIDRDGLDIRITNKYKDAYRHLDQEERIGNTETLRIVERHVDEEHGESGSNLLFIRIQLDEDPGFPVDRQMIKDAIYNTYSYHGCGHEHDCCGCISQTVNRMKRLRVNNFGDTEVWAVSVSWYRNC